jgi:hypothetical protein
VVQVENGRGQADRPDSARPSVVPPPLLARDLHRPPGSPRLQAWEERQHNC